MPFTKLNSNTNLGSVGTWGQYFLAALVNFDLWSVALGV